MLAAIVSSDIKKVVLAYSGGLDTSVILAWLRETYAAEVVAFCADVGQAEELDGLPEKARKTGAVDCIISDLRAEFVRDYCFPMLRANAVYEGEYLLGTAIARPIIAKAMMDVARECGADAIAHGATGKGNDQVRFELAALAIDPRIRVIAPWREWDLRSRSDCIEYGRTRGIDVGVTKDKPYSMDRNLFHISYEGGILEDPWNEPDEAMFVLTTDPAKAPDSPEYLTIRYADGDPVAVDGAELEPAALLQRLNELGGRHGVGRVDVVENRFVGMKSRGGIRDSRRYDPAQGTSGDRIDHARSRGHASTRWPDHGVRRHGVPRHVVRSRAARSPGTHRSVPARRERRGAYQVV